MLDLNLFFYVERPICRTVTRPPAISSLASPPVSDAPFWLEEFDRVQGVVELGNASLVEAAMIPPLLKMAGGFRSLCSHPDVLAREGGVRRWSNNIVDVLCSSLC